MKRRHRFLLGITILAGIGLALNKPLRLEQKLNFLFLEIGGMRVNAGWKKDKFPESAVSYLTPKEIAEVYGKTPEGRKKPITSYSKPVDGSLRIMGTGHSFMQPGFKTFPHIARAAGFDQPPLLTHIGSGITGSARYKWEQENGIFEFEGKPVPKLLASVANAKWDIMMWGPYFRDRPAYYMCWMDFCLKYNPEMKFYVSNAWPQMAQFGTLPSTEKEITSELMAEKGAELNSLFKVLLKTLNKSHPNRAFVLPTSDAMVLAVDYFKQGRLPGVEGIHRIVGKNKRSLWNDRLGHLGPGMGNLEGYVFYAAIYGRSPELINEKFHLDGKNGYPSLELDRVFRKIAWQAVIDNPLSGVKDVDGDGIAD